jgi:hypothetical protein
MHRQFSPRTRGSVRFAPYYKLQWFDPRTLSWRDVPRAFPSAGEALAYTGPDRTVQRRVMEVTPEGRRVAA